MVGAFKGGYDNSVGTLYEHIISPNPPTILEAGKEYELEMDDGVDLFGGVPEYIEIIHWDTALGLYPTEMKQFVITHISYPVSLYVVRAFSAASKSMI